MEISIPKIKETRQLLVKLPAKLYDELALESARRTTLDGHEVTKQELLIEGFGWYKDANC